MCYRSLCFYIGEFSWVESLLIRFYKGNISNLCISNGKGAFRNSSKDQKVKHFQQIYMIFLAFYHNLLFSWFLIWSLLSHLFRMWASLFRIYVILLGGLKIPITYCFHPILMCFVISRSLSFHDLRVYIIGSLIENGQNWDWICLELTNGKRLCYHCIEIALIQ